MNLARAVISTALRAIVRAERCVLQTSDPEAIELVAIAAVAIRLAHERLAELAEDVGR